MQHGPFADVYESNRRSVYLMTQRLQRHPYLGMFDGADPALSTASRSVTITPIQALFSMNSDFIHRTSAFWASKLMDRPDEASRVREAFRTVFGRLPEAAESAKSAAYLADVRQTLSHSGAGEKEVPRQALASYLRVLLASNEFLFLE